MYGFVNLNSSGNGFLTVVSIITSCISLGIGVSFVIEVDRGKMLRMSHLPVAFLFVTCDFVFRTWTLALFLNIEDFRSWSLGAVPAAVFVTNYFCFLFFYTKC
jgi:hypothetical protein